MDHFDDAYGLIYGKKWGSIRAALLTKHKSVALVNNFADPRKTCQEMELSGATNLKSLVEQKGVVEEDRMNFTNDHHDDEFMQGKSLRITPGFVNVTVSFSSMLNRYEQMAKVE